MKWNCYDLFDHYDPEKNGIPEISVQPIAADAVREWVFAKTGTASAEKRRNRFRLTKLTAVLAAAVVLVTGGTMITAAAGLGGMDRFFQSLFVTETPASPEKMENLLTMPGACFDSTNPDVQFSLLGMYGDQSQAMLSFELTVENGVKLIPDQTSPLVEYAVVDADGTSKQLSYAGQTCTIRADATAENVYYLNLFITDTDLQGKTLDITFQNFYTSQQIQTIYDAIQEMQNEWRSAYIRETLGEDALVGLEEGELPEAFDVDQWKAYWDAQNYDQLTEEKNRELYDASACAVAGTWHTQLQLDFPVAEPITAEYTYGEIKLQTLSAQISHPDTMSCEDQMVIYTLTLKDGQKVTTDDAVTDEETQTEEYISCNHYAEWSENRNTETEILCYEEPIAPQDIAEITMIQYEFHWDDNAPEENGWIVTNEEVIYMAQ